MSSPVQNRAQFERAIERLIQAADKANRGDDLDRVVSHIATTPPDVSRLAGLMMLIDDDVRPELAAAVDAFRRFRTGQGEPVDDDSILAVIRSVYDRLRGA